MNRIIRFRVVAVFLIIAISVYIFHLHRFASSFVKMIKMSEASEQHLIIDKTNINIDSLLPKYSNPRRYMIYDCSGTCGGLADRQKGIVAAYLMSIMTNRTFGINNTKPMDIISFVKPNKIDWYISKSKLDGLSVQRYFPMESRDFLTRLSNLDLNTFFNKDVIYFRGNLNFVTALRKHYNAMKAIPEVMLMSNSELYYGILKLLFKLDKSLQEELNSIYEKQIKNRKLVCAHIRMGKNPTIPTDIAPMLHANEIDVIWRFLDQYKIPAKYSVFVASDSSKIKDLAKQRFPLQYVDVPGPIVHIDQIGYRNDSTGMKKVFLEQSLLSKCDVLVVTKSGFSIVAAYLRNKSRDLYCYLNGTLFPCRHDLIDQIYMII